LRSARLIIPRSSARCIYTVILRCKFTVSIGVDKTGSSRESETVALKCEAKWVANFTIVNRYQVSRRKDRERRELPFFSQLSLSTWSRRLIRLESKLQPRAIEFQTTIGGRSISSFSIRFRGANARITNRRAAAPLLAKRRPLIIAIYVFNIVAAVLNNEISSRRHSREGSDPERESGGTLALVGTERERDSEREREEVVPGRRRRDKLAPCVFAEPRRIMYTRLGVNEI